MSDDPRPRHRGDDVSADPPATTPGNEFDPFPTTNRATRRHCKHLWKTIGDRTACVECGETLTRDEETP